MADLAWAGRPVVIRLKARRFFCRVKSCPRRIFVERLGEHFYPHARKSTRLVLTLRRMALALGGRGGARLAQSQALPVSPSTLLRLVVTNSLPKLSAPRVVGIDDWAWKKGKSYGTIIVDLERHIPIDLLADRKADSVADWFIQHPGIEIVSRDRSSLYADGIKRGAPQAIQVADRFHLVKNLAETLEKFLLRKRTALLAASQSLGEQSDGAARKLSKSGVKAPPLHHTTQSSAKAEAASVAKHQSEVERYHRIKALHAKGVDRAKIARQVGVSRRTVYRYLAMSEPPSGRRLHQPGARVLDPYKAFLVERWNKGCRNAQKLVRELKAMGYQHSARSVDRFITELRVDSGKARSFKAVKAQTIYSATLKLKPPLTPLQASRLLISREAQLQRWEREYLHRLCQLDIEIKQTTT